MEKSINQSGCECDGFYRRAKLYKYFIFQKKKKKKKILNAYAWEARPILNIIIAIIMIFNRSSLASSIKQE